MADCYLAWRRQDRDREAAWKAAQACGRRLRRCEASEDCLWPRLGRDWLDRQEIDAPERERLARFAMLVRRWQGAATLPIDQLVLAISQDLFDQPDELAVAFQLAVGLRRSAHEHPRWGIRELIDDLAAVAGNRRRFAAFAPDQAGKTSQHVGVAYEWRASTDDVAVVLSRSEFYERRGTSLSGSFASVDALAGDVEKKKLVEPWSVELVIREYLTGVFRFYSDADLEQSSLPGRLRAGSGQGSKITIVIRTLDRGAVFPSFERGFVDTGDLGECGSGHAEAPADAAYFVGCQHSQMAAHGFVVQALPFVIKKLEVTGTATANGQIDDLQRGRRIAGPVSEDVVIQVGGDRTLAA